MWSFKPVTAALAASLAVHSAALVGLGDLGVGSRSAPASHKNRIYISCIKRIPDQPLPKPKRAAGIAPKKAHARPIPRPPVPQTAPANEIRPAEERSVQSDASPVRQADELALDPKTGRIFVDYFARIKDKIGRTTKKEYLWRQEETGEVTLLFILGSDGQLKRSSVVEVMSGGSAGLEAIALDCLRQSAPFEPFPDQLGAGQISFKVTVCFGDK